jgi:zinc protease
MFTTAFTRFSLKTRVSISTLIAFLFLFIASSLNAQPALQKVPSQDAANIAFDQKLPTDPSVIIGELDNGIHYYIRNNTEPANRADIRLVINSGSILEDEKQRGLAHFLEHMAFQGTEHFEKQAIIDFMESIGMRVGSGINAFTGLDETTYMLQLPTDDESHLATAFQILKDWATGIKFDPEEIESERKVVIEEWRQGQGVQARIRDKIIPIILKDSLYARRLPIGTLENIQSFNRNDFLHFYRDWYRPDLMAVIAVGDFDTAVIEKLIHKQFEPIPAPENPKNRKTYTIPEHDKTLFAIAIDPEVQITQLAVYHKFPNNYDWTVGGYRQRIVEELYNAMLNERFNEISTKPDPPFMLATSNRSPLVRPLDVYILQAIVQETGIERGLETLLVESERVARFGFTETEFERQKTSYLRSLDQIYTNRESRTSSSHAAEMTRSFLTGESIPGIEYEVALRRRFISGITLEEINQVGKNWISDSNRVIVLTAPEKPDLVVPSEKDLKSVLESALKKNIKPYEATTVEGLLLDKIPAGSKVIEKHELKGGLIEWKLANGITVILKPTDFKKDEILFTAFSPGGTSLASDEDYIVANTASSLITLSGVGKFNLMNLRKKLTGKVANVLPTISEYEEGLTGNASLSDLETLFQLIYLRMTAPRSDETIYNIIKMQMRQQLANRTANPAIVFNDTWNRLVYSDHPRKQPPSVAMLDKMDLNKSLAFYKDRFADDGDFIFIFVGSIDLEQMQPLVETYLGALPNSGREETWKDVGIRTMREGIIKETVRKGQEPKATRRIGFNGVFPEIDNLFEKTRLRVTVQLLQTRLRNVMRETMGGTYIAQVNSGISRIPLGQYLVSIDFTSAPERVDELTEALFNEIKSLKETGPKEEEVADIRQAMLRAHETGLEQNAFWLAGLKSSYSAGVNPGADQILGIPEAVNAVTAEFARDTFRKYYDMENYIQVTLLPEESTKKESN